MSALSIDFGPLYRAGLRAKIEQREEIVAGLPADSIAWHRERGLIDGLRLAIADLDGLAKLAAPVVSDIQRKRDVIDETARAIERGCEAIIKGAAA
ncbi:MAG: hypothetical protein U1E62_05215 [Alsobacter sp.]